MHRDRRLVFLCLLVAAWMSSGRAGAQSPIFAPHEELSTERPEAWAMTYFGSALLATGLGSPTALSPGTLELGLEGGWLPSLSRRQRTVGFNGTKEEDLNRTSVVGRLRGRIALPGRLALEAAFVPPVESDGVDPRFYSLGLALASPEWPRWRGGLRLHTDFGNLTGDLTCPAAVAAAGEDPIANPYGCQGPSHDEIRYRIVSLEATVALAPRGPLELSPYVALGVHRFDETFQVDSRWLDLVDRSRLHAEDTTWSIAGGLAGSLAARWGWSAEVFYSPLSPVSRDFGRTTSTDNLVNARLLLRWRSRSRD